MEAGCELFVTETESVLTRGTIPPSCIVSAVDAAKKDLPLYVAGEKEATREGEPGHSFRAKHDYEEAASSSSAPPPKQAAVAPKAVASKKMLKSSSSKPELHLPLSLRLTVPGGGGIFENQFFYEIFMNFLRFGFMLPETWQK